MTRSVFISLCIVALTIQYTVQLECGNNEVSTDCPANCPSDHCPTYEHQDRPCTKPNVCGQSQCKCRFNYRRSVNGTCIPTRDCPPFACDRPNEEYVSCPSYCPTDDCAQASIDGSCPYFNILMVVECSPQCRCINGYWRKNGICVPYSQCPQNQQLSSLHVKPVDVMTLKRAEENI